VPGTLTSPNSNLFPMTEVNIVPLEASPYQHFIVVAFATFHSRSFILGSTTNEAIHLNVSPSPLGASSMG